MVSGGGLEPPRVAPYAPQTYASASSAIPTKLVPKVGFEPTQAYAYGALNTACLPVPPLRRRPNVGQTHASIAGRSGQGRSPARATPPPGPRRDPPAP